MNETETERSQRNLARAEREMQRDSYQVPRREKYAVPFEFEATDAVTPDTKALAASGLRRLMARRDPEHGMVEFYVAPAGVESAGFVLGVERKGAGAAA